MVQECGASVHAPFRLVEAIYAHDRQTPLAAGAASAESHPCCNHRAGALVCSTDC